MKNKKEKITELPQKRLNLSFLIGLLAIVIIYISVFNIFAYNSLYDNYKEPSYKKFAFEENLKEMLLEPNSDLVRYTKNINRYYVYFRDFLQIPSDFKVTETDMASDMVLLQQNFNSSEQRALELYNEIIYDADSTAEECDMAEKQFISTLNKLLENYRDEIASIKEIKLKDKLGNYELVEDYLTSNMEYTYYLNDSILNKTFTNIKGLGMDISLDYYMENESYLNINLSEISATFSGVQLNTSFELNGITGYIMIPKEQPIESSISYTIDNAVYNSTSLIRNYRNAIIIYGATVLVSSIVLLLLSVNIYKDKGGYLISSFKWLFNLYLKIPFILKIIGFLFSSFYLYRNLYPALDIFIYNGIQLLSFGTYVLDLLISFISIILFSFYCYYVAKDISRLKKEFEYNTILKFFKNLDMIRKYSPFFLTFLWLFMFFVAIITLIFALYLVYNSNYYLDIFSTVVFAIFTSSVIFIMMDIITCFSKLGYYIDIISDGEMIEIPHETTPFSKSINKLNKLSEGLYQSLDETLKSERTKTELITNVSHDLKTPLTSIINYVDLLSRIPALPKDAKDYIEVLKQKSDRLKILIDDLFEAAKLNSQSLELTLEPIDIIQLFEQSLGELSEKLFVAKLEVKFASNIDKAILMLDGKRMWRVFENLLNNIVNYSPEGSRVYVNINDYEKSVEIILRNISNHELDFDASELFDRFKRGDASRTTEGSGLGLSISKNIIDLHGGKMDIVIDGDLFKVIIMMNKSLI